MSANTRLEFRGEKPLDVLIEVAGQCHCAAITYRKGATNKDLPRRIIEPYSFTDGKQDVMVKAFQLEPEAGWRFFMIHKLEDVRDTGRPFKLRARVTLPDATVEHRYDRDEAWSQGRKWYRNLVSDALADGVVTKDELRSIESFRAAHRLTADDVRFVHASLFHRCLGAVIEDGTVDDEERAQLRFLHKVLSTLGWSVTG